jgi:surface protein
MRKFSILTFLILVTAFNSCAQFITVWKTNNIGTSANNRITIPAIGTNYTIQWQEVGNPGNNGTAVASGSHTITFASVGTYQVSIIKGAGSFDGIAFNNTGDRRKLLEIVKWGDTQWKTMIGAYDGCSNLTITATDIPDLSDVNATTNMFQNCTLLTTVPGMNNWDVSNITHMDGMFYGARSFNQPIDLWIVDNVINMSYMFTDARTFNQPIGTWNVGNVTDMRQMFATAIKFNQNLNDWNVERVTDMGQMFLGASVFNQPLADWDVSSCLNMAEMFNDASAFNQPLETWDVSNVTDMMAMFVYALAFNQPIGTWDVGNVTSMIGMFYGAAVFNQSLGAWDLGNVAGMDIMLSNSGIDCGNLTYTLQGWANNAQTPSNITFDATGRDYSGQASTALHTLMNTKQWSISIGNPIECTALEVTLIKFEVRNESGQVNLTWATSSEKDNDYFEVQRSDDARVWVPFAKVTGAGTANSLQNYTETDPKPFTPISYYRLKIVDLAGEVEYSTIRSVKAARPETRFAYPNPATSSVTFSGISQGTLRIYNNRGYEIMQTQVLSEQTEIIIQTLPAGVYTAKMNNGWSTRFIKK